MIAGWGNYVIVNHSRWGNYLIADIRTGRACRSPGCATPRPPRRGRLYWRDRNSRFHRYDRIEPSANVGALIDEIDYDPTGIFCG